MHQFVESIQISIASRNWLAALSTTLTVPDMAGWAQFPELKSGARYKKWFNENLAEIYKRKIPGFEHTFLTAEDCWALRCSFLHSGQDDLTGESTKSQLERFVFSVTDSHCLHVNGALLLNVRAFCTEIVAATEVWLDRCRTDEATMQRLASMLMVRTGPFNIAPGICVE